MLKESCVWHSVCVLIAVCQQINQHGDVNIQDNLEEDGHHDGDQYNNDVWKLCTNSAPDDPFMWPTVGNGHVATVVHSDRVFMNGIYNGRGMDSKRARVPAYTSIVIQEQLMNYNSKMYCLHLDKGMFVERYVADHWTIEVTWYAHRTIPSLLVTVLNIQTDGQQPALNIDLVVNRGNESEGLNMTEGTSEITNASYIHGLTKIAETEDSGLSAVHIYHTDIPARIAVPGGVVSNSTHRILASVSAFKETALLDYRLGLRLQNDLEGRHIKRWREVWEGGRFDIKGNRDLAAAAYSALYYMISSMPVDEGDPRWPFIGLSPGDLAHGPREEEYKGHVFWDQDTWMFPPINVLHTDLGKTLIRTRIRTLDAAFTIAQRTGYKGARYPWESAFTGFETCPAAQYSEYEIHVTGDVAMAVKQYLMMTRDTELLRTDRLEEEIIGIADFWRSRAVYNEDLKLYEIYDVMPPDEWNYPVNNSAYTNAVAKQSLLLPKFALDLLGERAPPAYEAIADRMYIPLDTERQFHPEYDGFTDNTTVKQADVILLGFPLELDMTDEQRQNDLIIYASITPRGPAMTWSMFTIGWLELNEMDMAKETFYRQLINKQEPFNVWSEYAGGGGCKNFITGQGGYLQSLMFGYGGLRIHKDKLTLNCKPIPDTSGFSFKGLDYLGNSIDIDCDVTHINLTQTNGSSTPLVVELVLLKEKYRLHSNKTLTFERQPVAITGVPSSSSSLNSPVNIIIEVARTYYNVLLSAFQVISNIVLQ